MTTRPSLATKRSRPNSAIFIGSLSAATPNGGLPDLPDPPSSPSSTSGLPSPPASNSTGSGGDNATSVGSVRFPLSDAGAGMQNGSSSSLGGERSASRSSSDDGEDGNDEDHTAKLSDDRRLAFQASTKDNQSALQRVKSLTQRNRLVLNKLASISSGSRLSTPSPPALKRATRSPAPSSSNSASSSRLSDNSSRLKRSESFSRASGSETEREPMPASVSSDDLSETPPSTSTVPFRSESVRQRRTSAPSSPSKAFTREPSCERSIGPSESATVGRRSLRSESRAESRNGGDIEAAALAAVANSRRRSPSDARRRQPLPREFRTEQSSLDGRPPIEPPSTPHRISDRASPGFYTSRGPPSPSPHVTAFNDPPQSPRAKAHRFSTVREMTRRHQTRWMSQELTPPRPLNNTNNDDGAKPQNRRGGSNESPLVGAVGGRSVVGESLRAAGLARRREEGEDIFGGNSLQIGRRVRLSGDLDLRPQGGRTETSRPSTRLNDRPGTTDGVFSIEPRTPANSTQVFAQRNSQTLSSRPSTSMAAFHEEPRTAPPLFRSHKSAYPIPEKERQTIAIEGIARPPSQARNVYPISSAAAHDRSTASPSTLGRRSAAAPLNQVTSGSASTPEHTRLMLDSLNMFESHLARLPTMGSTTTVTIPELFRSAQNIVHSTNALNTLLRSGTAHALEEQIDAEVADDTRSVDPVEIWRDVGGEYRESLRVSDELVRTMTSFLLGVGKLLREATVERTHNRTASLDETSSRRLTPDITQGPGRTTSDSKLSSDGRSSAEYKRRWDSSSGEMNGATTSFTSMHSSSASMESASSSRPSATSRTSAEANPSTSSPANPIEPIARKFSRLSLNTSRQSDSFQEMRDSYLKESAPRMQHSISEDPPQFVDSPLSASTVGRNLGGLRRATTLAVPPPLPTLPSESLLARSSSAKVSARRGKISTASNATVRANSIFPSLGNATTAITAMAVQASPERPSLPTNTRSTANVRATLSRSSGAALAGLQQHMERDGRKRTISASEALEAEVRHALSGSETEREPRATVDSRPRMSLDSNPGITLGRGTGVRDRRGTVTGLFTRN